MEKIRYNTIHNFTVICCSCQCSKSIAMGLISKTRELQKSNDTRESVYTCIYTNGHLMPIFQSLTIGIKSPLVYQQPLLFHYYPAHTTLKERMAPSMP